MADKRKFAALAGLHRQSSDTETLQINDEPSAMGPNVSKGRGRPATGKRSNPEWKLYSHFLKKRTQHAAATRLQAEDNGRDLSDVLQGLLENWLKT